MAENVVFYNVRDFAKMKNVSDETVRRWLRSGKIKGNRTSKKEGWMIPVAEKSEVKDDSAFLYQAISNHLGEIYKLQSEMIRHMIEIEDYLLTIANVNGKLRVTGKKARKE